MQNNTSSNLFTLNWKNVLGAIASTVVVAVLSYIISVNDAWKLSFHSIVNISIMAGAGSLLKALLTDEQGNLLGVIPVK